MLYRLLCDAAHQAGGAIVRVGGTATHVHMVAAIPPTLSVGSFVQQVKSVSSRITNRSDVTAKPFAWQTGYGAFTANPHDLDTLVRYVDRQKQHHRVGTTQRHLERTS